MTRDPVAENIRNEMNRDAAPTPEEAHRKHEKYLKSEGCEFCGYDEDADYLNEAGVSKHNCMETQTGRPKRVVYCDDCGFDSEFYKTWLRVKSAREDDIALVVYECGMWTKVKEPEKPTTTMRTQTGYDEDGNPTFEDKEIPVPGRRPAAEAPIECPRCFSDLDHIINL